MQYTAPRYDNANADTLFFPLRKSTLYKFKKQVSGKGKRAVSIAYDNAAQSGNEDNDYADLPSSKKQLIDLSRSLFVDNEVGDTLAYNEELGDNLILWYHSNIPEDLWVIGTNDIASEMSKAAIFRPISVDPEFNFGIFDVTPFIYRSFMFQCKSKNVAQKWVHATMIGPTIIQHSKIAATYETAMRSIALKCKLESTSDMFVITDGEPALIAVILKTFEKCLLLKCTRHFENNCKDYLKHIGIHGSIKDVMLDVAFGENGLVEAENKLDLKEKMKNGITLLSEMEQQCLSTQLLKMKMANLLHLSKVARKQF